MTIQGKWIKTIAKGANPEINTVWTIHEGVLHVYEKNIRTNEVKLMQGKVNGEYVSSYNVPKQLTAKEINKRYKNVYVQVNETYNENERQWLYEVVKTSKTIRENMTLGQDVGTALAYTR